MSDRIKGGTPERSWQSWIEEIKLWDDVVAVQAEVHPATLQPNFRHFVDWLEQDGFSEKYFIESTDEYAKVWNGPTRTTLRFHFQNHKAAMNFKVRWV